MEELSSDLGNSQMALNSKKESKLERINSNSTTSDQSIKSVLTAFVVRYETMTFHDNEASKANDCAALWLVSHIVERKLNISVEILETILTQNNMEQIVDDLLNMSKSNPFELLFKQVSELAVRRINRSLNRRDNLSHP